MGTASLALRRYDLARKSYETAIALDPDYVLALVNLGVTLSLMGHFIKAITHYQAGLKIDLDDINSMIYIGSALQSKGEYDAAIESIARQLRSLQPALKLITIWATHLKIKGTCRLQSKAIRRHWCISQKTRQRKII